MDMMTKIGGRKFLMALVVVGCSMVLEMKSEKGLTPTMAAFLAGIVAAFSAANYAVSAKHMSAKRPEAPPPGMTEEQAQVLVGVLGKLGSDLAEVKEIAGNTGKAVVGLAQRRS
jgi:drug/metabolite transporter (DMT)-like permease